MSQPSTPLPIVTANHNNVEQQTCAAATKANQPEVNKGILQTSCFTLYVLSFGFADGDSDQKASFKWHKSQSNFSGTLSSKVSIHSVVSDAFFVVFTMLH